MSTAIKETVRKFRVTTDIIIDLKNHKEATEVLIKDAIENGVEDLLSPIKQEALDFEVTVTELPLSE